VSGDWLPHFGLFPSWNFAPWNHHAAHSIPKIDSKWHCQSSTQSFARGSRIFFLVCLCLIPAAAWAETHFEAAQRLLESGHETEARRALELELEVRPRNLEARYNLAVLLTRIGHKPAAIQLYRENIKHGKHLPTVVNLSALYRGQAKRKAATQLLKKATRTFRSEAVPWYLLASMAEREKHTPQADHDYRRALKADRKNGFAHIRYARFLAMHQHLKPAITHANRAVHLLPECAACFKIEGDIFRQNHAPKQALIAYQKAASLSPNRAIRLNIIAMLNALGEHRRANMMQQALKGELKESVP